LSSSINFGRRKSGVVLGIAVITIIAGTRLDDLAVASSFFSTAASTTTTRISAGSSRRRAPFRESVSRASSSDEVAALSLTPPETISHAVISNIPTRAFQKSKSELGDLLLVDETGSHDFEEEDLTFEVRTSSSRASTVFHIGTLKSRAAEVLSKHASKGFDVYDSGGSTIESSGRDVSSQSFTIAVKEMLVETRSKTKSMGKFVDHTDHVLFM